MLGHAVGVIGLSFADFCLLTAEEFSAICAAYAGKRTDEFRTDWERTRTAAAIGIQPHVRKRVTPQSLLPFPWDKKKPERPLVPKEEAKRKLERIRGKKR